MAKISNLVTFAIILGLITLLIYLYYLRKRRTQQTILWLRAQAQNANTQNNFGQPGMIYPYGLRGQNYYCNNGLVFMPTSFHESAQIRSQNFQGACDYPGGGHPNSFQVPHSIAAPPYTPWNLTSPSTLDDLPPPYSAIIGTEEPKAEVTTIPGNSLHPETHRTLTSESSPNPPQQPDQSPNTANK